MRQHYSSSPHIAVLAHDHESPDCVRDWHQSSPGTWCKRLTVLELMHIG